MLSLNVLSAVQQKGNGSECLRKAKDATYIRVCICTVCLLMNVCVRVGDFFGKRQWCTVEEGSSGCDIFMTTNK